MMLEGLAIPKAVCTPIAISGDWSPEPKRDWRGFASAAEPLVAVLFLRCGRHVQWCISERPHDEKLEVRLALFPLGQSELEVQVSVSLGHTSRYWDATLASGSYRPAIPASQDINTGEVVRLARVAGGQPIDFLGLFLAKSDTKCGRKGIWHLRPELLEGLHPDLVRVLRRGRTGTYEEQG